MAMPPVDDDEKNLIIITGSMRIKVLTSQKKSPENSGLRDLGYGLLIGSGPGQHGCGQRGFISIVASLIKFKS